MKSVQTAVAVFQGTNNITGSVLFTNTSDNNCQVKAHFTQLPLGKHGFHIHKSGDLRDEGCKGACDHYHKGPLKPHGGPPTKTTKSDRHTGDLGNVEGPEFQKIYILQNVSANELLGRAVIIHEDEDDLGLGPFEDSLTTGHSGKRIGCAIIGRVDCNQQKQTTRKIK